MNTETVVTEPPQIMGGAVADISTEPTPLPLSEYVRDAVQRYFADMDGHLPEDLYRTVLNEMERPLLEVVMDKLSGNQSRAANVLGLNRTTLRKKLQQHQLAGE